MIPAREINRVFKFILERESIREKKERGEPKPWTKDPILLNYRFTNVRREDDKVTRWIAENWRRPHENDPELWFAMAVARYINWPPTLEKIGYPVPFNAKRICALLNEAAGKKIVKRYMARSHKETPHKIELIQTQMSCQVFGGAYFLNSIGPKIESIVNDRLNVLWKRRHWISALLGDQVVRLSRVYDVLRAEYGFGSFMAAQVVADLKYTPRFNESRMQDWWTFAAPGPGSKRGLNRLCGRPVNAPWKDAEWQAALCELQTKLNTKLGLANRLHAQDVQGVAGCEWDKYERVRLGEGRPKVKYPGGLK